MMTVTGVRQGRRRMLGAVLAATAAALLPVPAAADLADALPRIKPSVVAVGTYQRSRNPAFRFFGTGFVVGDGRLVATNAHVVPEALAEEKMEALAIAVPGEGQSVVHKVVLLARDKERDLAVLRLEGAAALPPLSLEDGEEVREGQSVAFTGFPIGGALGLFHVTHRGIISAITPIGIPQARGRELSATLIRRLANDPFSVYQLDATAYPGNSGSPLFDPESGRVLGVLNMVFVKSTKENILSDPSGIAYAIPARYLRAMLERLQ